MMKQTDGSNTWWDGKHFAFFQNADCEFFPCHKIESTQEFSCLFCYCPLYALEENCGGAFSYTDAGVKDCSNCLFPHMKKNYGAVTARVSELIEQVRKKSPEEDTSDIP